MCDRCLPHSGSKPIFLIEQLLIFIANFRNCFPADQGKKTFDPFYPLHLHLLHGRFHFLKLYFFIHSDHLTIPSNTHHVLFILLALFPDSIPCPFGRAMQKFHTQGHQNSLGILQPSKLLHSQFERLDFIMVNPVQLIISTNKRASSGFYKLTQRHHPFFKPSSVITKALILFN